MEEILKKVVSFEKQLMEFKKRAQDVYAKAIENKIISPDEKRKIASIAERTKVMQERLNALKGNLSLAQGQSADQGPLNETNRQSAPEPIYGYTKNEDAEEPYLAAKKLFDSDHSKMKTEASPTIPMEDHLKILEAAVVQIEKSSKSGAFVEALDGVRSAQIDLNNLLALANEPDRKKWLTNSANFSTRVDKMGSSSEPQFVELRHQSLTDRDSLYAEAKSGKYSEALESLKRLEANLITYETNLESFNADYMNYLSELRRFETEVARFKAYENPSRAMKALRIQIDDKAEVIYRFADSKEFQNALIALTEGFTLLGELIFQSDDPNRTEYLALLPDLDRWLMNTMNKDQGILGEDFENISTKNSEMHNAADAGLYKEALSLGWDIKTLLEQLELNLSELKLYNEYVFRLNILQPELGEAIKMVAGEESYTSVVPLRQKLQDLVATGDDHVKKREYRQALDLASDIQDAMIQVTAEIETIEAEPFAEEEIDFTVSFMETAQSYGIDYFTFITINHELVKKRGINGLIEPGDKIIIPNPTLQIEEYEIDGTRVVLSKKDWIKLEDQLVKRALYRFDNHYVAYFNTLEGIYHEQLRLNDSFVGRCVAPYASTNPSKTYKSAKSTIEYTRNKIKSESYNDLQDSIQYMVVEINKFGTDLNKWRDELFGVAGNFVGALEFVRDGSIVVLATLATGPMTVGASFARSAAINGLTNAGAGLVINIAEAATEVATEQKVDWGKVGLDISFDLAFDFVSGAAVDRFLGAFKGILGNSIKKESSELVTQWVVKDMMASKGLLNLLVDVDQSIIADAVLDISGGWVMSKSFDGYWKKFQKVIIMDVLKTDGKKDIDMSAFAEISVGRIKSVAPQMYDGIIEAAILDHGVENLVNK